MKIQKCSMMPRWHHSDSSKAMSTEHDSVKKKTLELNSRSILFSAGLARRCPSTEKIISGGFRGGSKGSLKPPSWPKLFYFHGEFQAILCEIRQTNPPFLSLNPLFRNPASAPDYHYRIGTYIRTKWGNRIKRQYT